MPNTKSAIRTQRKQARRRVTNLRVQRGYKDAARELKKDPSPENLRTAYKTLDKAAKKRVVAPNKANRLKSRLSKLVGSASQNQTAVKTKPATHKKAKSV